MGSMPALGIESLSRAFRIVESMVMEASLSAGRTQRNELLDRNEFSFLHLIHERSDIHVAAFIESDLSCDPSVIGIGNSGTKILRVLGASFNSLCNDLDRIVRKRGIDIRLRRIFGLISGNELTDCRIIRIGIVGWLWI